MRCTAKRQTQHLFLRDYGKRNQPRHCITHWVNVLWTEFWRDSTYWIQITQKSHVNTLQSIVHSFEPSVVYLCTSSSMSRRGSELEKKVRHRHWTNVDDSTLIIQFNSLMAFTQSIESYRHMPNTYPVYLRWLNARRCVYSAGNWRIK